MPKKTEKSRLWEFDPSIFDPLPKASILERYIVSPVRNITRRALFGIAFAYPIALVTIGLVFGGLAFWISFAGSAGIIYIVIKKSGYAANFANWDVGRNKFIGLIGGFGMTLAFVYGLIYLSTMIVVIFAGVLTAVLILAIMLKGR